MVTKKAKSDVGKQLGEGQEKVSLTVALSKRPEFKIFSEWLIGDTPLICHAWSEKAKREMLAKQVRAVKPGKEARDPEADYATSLYDMGDGTYGFPVTAFKNCILSVAHKDKGIPRSTAMGALWLNATMVRVRPALAGAICDMPLVRIWGSKPEMREDMVRVGAGLNKTASLAYRSQFTTWAVRLSGQINTAVLSPESLAFLIMEGGRGTGIGEWRNEKKGMFGSFHLASVEESKAWTKFADGKGPLPQAEGFALAAE